MTWKLMKASQPRGVRGRNSWNKYAHFDQFYDYWVKTVDSFIAYFCVIFHYPVLFCWKIKTCLQWNNVQGIAGIYFRFVIVYMNLILPALSFQMLNSDHLGIQHRPKVCRPENHLILAQLVKDEIEPRNFIFNFVIVSSSTLDLQSSFSLG